jgi:hypothetical protein
MEIPTETGGHPTLPASEYRQVASCRPHPSTRASSEALSCDTFRHSCAIHILEDGYDIRTVRERLGYTDASTTTNYTHVLNRGWDSVRSPADRLLGPAAHIALWTPDDAPSRSR